MTFDDWHKFLDGVREEARRKSEERLRVVLGRLKEEEGDGGRVDNDEGGREGQEG